MHRAVMETAKAGSLLWEGLQPRRATSDLRRKQEVESKPTSPHQRDSGGTGVGLPSAPSAIMVNRPRVASCD
ncbi:hypothetical protein [Lysobacter gummosus]|uniref:hypothetical protein n=1 Tax=Lysobacter gummosus TaxID=262324 RepID=UPI00363D70DD